MGPRPGHKGMSPVGGTGPSRQAAGACEPNCPSRWAEGANATKGPFWASQEHVPGHPAAGLKMAGGTKRRRLVPAGPACPAAVTAWAPGPENRPWMWLLGCLLSQQSQALTWLPPGVPGSRLPPLTSCTPSSSCIPAKQGSLRLSVSLFASVSLSVSLCLSLSLWCVSLFLFLSLYLSHCVSVSSVSDSHVALSTSTVGITWKPLFFF